MGKKQTRKLPPGPRLPRKHGGKKVPPVLVVVCEGNTEVAILNELRATWGISSAKIALAGDQGVPSSVVKRAVALSKKNKTAEIWVVFDRDEHGSWARAIDRAHARSFKLGITNPCVELWGLLLHRSQTAPLTRQDAQKELAAVHPGFHHGKSPYFDLDTVLANLSEAHPRAKKLLATAQELAEPYGNPTTRFHELVERLRKLR